MRGFSGFIDGQSWNSPFKLEFKHYLLLKMVEYLGIGSSKQSYLHGEVECVLGYFSSFCLQRDHC